MLRGQITVWASMMFAAVTVMLSCVSQAESRADNGARRDERNIRWRIGGFVRNAEWAIDGKAETMVFWRDA